MPDIKERRFDLVANYKGEFITSFDQCGNCAGFGLQSPVSLRWTPSGSSCTAPHWFVHWDKTHIITDDMFIYWSQNYNIAYSFYIYIYFLHFTSLVIMLRTGIYTRMIITIRVTSVRLSANISFNSHLGWNARCDVERCSFGSGWDVNLRRTVGRRVSHLPADPIILAFV